MGTYRKEWSCCGSVTETDAWEPEACPFCTASPSPASDAAEDRVKLFKELNWCIEEGNIGPRSKKAIIAARNFVASTRTASDTRTAAGEAECDAALERRLEVREAELLRQRHKSDRLMEVLMSVYNLAPNGEDITLPDGRVMRFKDPNAAETLHYLGRAIHAIPEKVAQIAAAGPACQGGNTQPEPMKFGLSVAGYSVGAPMYFAPLGNELLAARTQADAGKVGAATQIAEGE